MSKPLWKNDTELFEIAKKELFVALVGDVLDQLEYTHQFVGQQIKPVSDDMVVIGRAKTVVECDIDKIPQSMIRNNKKIAEPFGIMFEALDSLKENEVYICDGGSLDYAQWGGLMSTRALYLKAVGAVVNGYHRDTNEILRLKFPTFSHGAYAQDQGPRGKVIDYDCPITFNGIPVHPGDVVFGDRDGVVIVPKDMVEPVFIGAIEKARGEKSVLKALQDGMSTEDAFNHFGIM
ncbi:RraA family protein [Flavivirga eckloniae]|uniref:Putative 4-hydroxy-4-methyl-2-oxoglutarate aldolase n=1 Tax=Flavivirga eckloniae TaxID=1803846 RepID=A0A2K9PUB7_9FLAO|nr:RraA family protein [Flavivirga eckloniae]AUP80653.1 dimethylmenaquinone methyltransferase [Flavivirga eckloniae]